LVEVMVLMAVYDGELVEAERDFLIKTAAHLNVPLDMKVLKQLIEVEIEEKLDHKNLNVEVFEFKELNPTAENIAVVIWNILRSKIDEKLELTVTLYETPRNFVVYAGN